MSIENTAKSFGAASVFTGVAWLSDLISAGLASLQISAATALLGAPQVVFTGAAVVVAGVVDFLFDTDLIAKAAGGIAVFLSIQMLVALLTLCVFYAIVRISPKGTYTTSDCLIAAGVFLLESAPFLPSFVFWGMFAAYLRRREISGIVSALPQTRALGAVARGAQMLGGGGGEKRGGLLGNIRGLLKR